jgi:AcrR family transcriptional regulator
MAVEQQGAPRSSRIVAELRQRIETGELAPGDRVPSTREITREWGVAMATATKVLTELRREGLVRAVPGVGTVVEAGKRSESAARPAPRRAATDQALTLERIVAAAMGVADAEGLAAVSMRRVAAELGVATMSLYRHVSDKDALLMQMLDAVFARSPLPEELPDGWRDRLALAARLWWQTSRRHPWLVPAMSVTRPQAVPSAMPFTELILATLHAEGLDLATALTACLALFNYVRGTALNLEMEAEAEAQSGMDSEEWMETQEPALHALLAGGRFPTLGRIVADQYDFDLDEQFEFGLQRFLDGLAALLDGAR